MADNNNNSEKKDPVKYKFGESELDLKDYITNLDHNVQKYINSKNWNDGQRQEFMNSYNQYLSALKEQLENGNNRFSSDTFGNMSDSLGILTDEFDGDISDSTNDYYYNDKGERITTDDYNSLRKRKQKNWQTFSSRREVASYFNTIGQALRDHVKNKTPKSKEKFNVNKHGFLGNWTKKNSPSGGKVDLTPYINMDKYETQADGSKKRNRTKRIEYLQGQIDDYLKGLEGDWDFTDTSYKNIDEYKQLLRRLSEGLSNGWDENDMILANQAGIGSNFYNDFFTEDENPNLTNEERTKLKEEQERALNQKEFSEYMQSLINTYNQNKGNYFDNDNAYNVGKLEYWDAENGFNGDAFRESFTKEELEDDSTISGRAWKLAKGIGNAASWIISPLGRAYWGYLLGEFSEKPFDLDMDTYINEYLKNPYTKEGKRALSAIIGSGQYETISEGPYAGMFYIPQTKDKTTQSGLVYDPNSGKLMNVFLGDIPSRFNKIRDAWKEGKGIVTPTDRYSLYKEGGNIQSMQIGGGFSFNDFMKEDRKENMKNRAEANNRTYKQQEAGERRVGTPGNVKNTLQNPSEGFTGTDMLRLGTIAADIVSMGSAFIPGYGTVVSAATGVGSSIGTFFADAYEDGLDGKDFGNLVTNLGLDVLGLIPGGGTASKGAKIAKTLAKYTTRIVATIGAMNTVSNAPQIIESFNKLKTPSELSVDDWRNISAGLGLITGGVAAGTRKYKKAKMKAENAIPDNVAVELVDKNGKNKTFLFSGDDAKAIRDANGDPSAIKKITSQYDNSKDFDVSTDTNFGWKGFKNDKDKRQIPVGFKQGKAKVFDVSYGYNMSGKRNGKIYAERGKWSADDLITDDNIARKTKIKGYLPPHKPTTTPSTNIAKQAKGIASESKVQQSQPVQPVHQQLKQLPPHTPTNEELSAQLDFQKLVDSSNKTKKKLASREAMIARYEELEQKGIKAYQEGTPGLTNSEKREFNLLRRGLSKRGTANITALREWVSKYGNKNYKSQALQDFESKYIENNKPKLQIPGVDSSVDKTWLDIIAEYGLMKTGGTLNLQKVRNFQTGGNIYTTTKVAGTDSNFNRKKKESSNKSDKSNFINNFLGNIDRSMLKYSIPRAIMTKYYNDKMTDEALSNAKNFQTTNAVELPTVILNGDLNAEIQGEQNAAKLRNKINNLQVTDMDKWLAANLETETNAQAFINQGKEASNKVYRDSEEKLHTWQKIDAENRKEAADFNKGQQLASQAKQSALRQAQISINGQMWKTIFEEAQQRFEAEKAQKKAYEDAQLRSDISTYVAKNLKTLAPDLSDEGIKLYQQYVQGLVSSSDLSNDNAKYNLFQQVGQVASNLESELYNKEKGIKRSKYYTPGGINFEFNPTNPYTTEIITSKNGSKLEIANLKARQKDNELFLKQINESIKRHDKALERLFKNLNKSKK